MRVSLLHRTLFGAFIYLHLLVSTATATIINVEDGDIVEGSTSNGGLQPDYLIDLNAPGWRPLFAECDRIRKSDRSFWEKVESISILIGSQVFDGRSYTDERYQLLMKKHRDNASIVPLSSYLKCAAGVCREHALVTHILLKRAGIPNSYVYALTQVSDPHTDAYFPAEDHAFVIVDHEGEKWTVDAYNRDYDGFLFDELVSPKGLTLKSSGCPLAEKIDFTRRVLKIHPFPRVYSHQGEVCADLLTPAS